MAFTTGFVKILLRLLLILGANKKAVNTIPNEIYKSEKPTVLEKSEPTAS